MNRVMAFAFTIPFLLTSSVAALTVGTDVLVPAAARGEGLAGSMWITDLYLLNPSSQATSVEVYWLRRDRANPEPPSSSFSLQSGEALILEDVILDTFGLSSGGGAFRVVADREVAVNSRIYNLKGGVTFGQGFEGVPRSAATAAGGTTDIAGLTHNARFRTNIVLIDADGGGSTVVLSLRDSSGSEIGSRTYSLRGFEPNLFSVTDLGVTAFDEATLHAAVTSGSAVVVASKVDNDSATGDPTTLEAWASPSGDATVDGVYHFEVCDRSDFASGGNVVVTGGEVTSITATYFNWDKVDTAGSPDCTELFFLRTAFTPPAVLADFEDGAIVEQDYESGGEISYTVTFSIAANLSVSGTIDAVGSNFPPMLAGCNGEFPTLTLSGGKSAEHRR
jgi:hypothetical protein